MKMDSFKLSTSWKRFARIGQVWFNNLTSDNVTDCERKETVSGISIVEGLMYVSGKIQVAGRIHICDENLEHLASIEIQSSNQECNSAYWCSSVESMEDCMNSCHSVTGMKKLN